jgi:hypothetical protein
MGRGMLSESLFVVPVANLMLKAYPMLNQVLPGTAIAYVAPFERLIGF